jgi:hypothetical protein
VSATLFEIEGITAGVPEFVIPDDYTARILDAFRPAEKGNYPPSWDREILGRLVVKKKAGGTITLMFPFSGKNPLCFTLDGVRCIRGGPYDPVFVGASESENVWATECGQLAGVLREINRQLTTGEKSDNLNRYFENLERSRGPEATRARGSVSVCGMVVRTPPCAVDFGTRECAGYSMAWQVTLNRPGLYRILFESAVEGTYVNVFNSADAAGPFQDQLQDNLEMAMRACRQDYGIADADWQQVPDERWH